jgi:hypothetical protein
MQAIRVPQNWSTRVPFQLRLKSHNCIPLARPQILLQPPILLHTTWARMSSTTPETPEWSAQRVRDTFLDYFKTKRQHTFGKGLSILVDLTTD